MENIQILDLKYNKLYGKPVKILYDRRGKPWFLAKDVSKILKYNTVFPTNNFFNILNTLPENNFKYSDKNLYISSSALKTMVLKSKVTKNLFKTLV